MKSRLSRASSTGAILGASLLITACGGSSGGGGPVTATIDDANKQDLAVAATEAAKSAANGGDASSNIPGLPKPAPSAATLIATMKDIASNHTAAIIQDLSSTLCSTGTAILDINDNTGNGSFTYNMCDTGFVIYDGTATINTTTSGSIFTTTVTMNNFTISYGGETETINFSVTCTTNTGGSTFDQTCTYSSSTLGIDGRTYSISDIDISGDAFSGYSMSATVTDPDHGNIMFSTNSPVTFNCTDGQPDSGTITVTAGSSTMTITFNSCSSFTVTFDGVATMYNWADI